MHIHRPRFRRTPSSRLSTFAYMSPIPQSPTEMSLQSRDTGFPEPFCSNRNTSLPHPDAIISPNACITEDDVSPARALMRHRKSFMTQRDFATRSSTFDTVSSSDDEGTLSAFGRLALNSLRAAELPGLDALLASEDGDSGGSTGTSSRDPNSPVHRGSEFEPRSSRSRRRRKRNFIRKLVRR